MITKRIGIDIMGVIIPKSTEGGTINEFMNCPALPDSLNCIKKLVSIYKPENIFVISSCPEYAEKVLIEWLNKNNFFDEINFCKSNINFCRTKADKAPIAEKLNLLYFIDDKISVLDHMKNIIPNRIQLTTDELLNEQKNNKDIISFINWPSIIKYISGKK
ncbi:MAG: hypothetical protein WCQ49_02115 [Candidatus Saccharibacteria bacterium]